MRIDLAVIGVDLVNRPLVYHPVTVWGSLVFTWDEVSLVCAVPAGVDMGDCPGEAHLYSDVLASGLWEFWKERTTESESFLVRWRF